MENVNKINNMLPYLLELQSKKDAIGGKLSQLHKESESIDAELKRNLEFFVTNVRKFKHGEKVEVFQQGCLLEPVSLGHAFVTNAWIPSFTAGTYEIMYVLKTVNKDGEIGFFRFSPRVASEDEKAFTFIRAVKGD